MISFIVPAHDEARLIGPTLQAITAAARSTCQPFEIIVVDDASTDQTADLARQMGALVVSVSYRHIAATRNAGARQACGDRLFFIDADTLIDHAVLRAALDALSKGACGGGASVRLAGTTTRTERWTEATLIRLFRMAGIAPGCFIFCTTEAFRAAGGFNETYFAGEDVALSRALARQGCFVVLRQSVRTSARKLRTFSVGEHLRLAARFAVRGRRMLKSREYLGLWYSERRDERK